MANSDQDDTTYTTGPFVGLSFEPKRYREEWRPLWHWKRWVPTWHASPWMDRRIEWEEFSFSIDGPEPH